MNIVLLSGGSGKRLWPLSNDIRSKQFIKIFKDENGCYESMVQRIIRQIKSVDSEGTITVATSRAQVSSLHNQLGDIDMSVEPERRETFPAIVLACQYLHEIKGLSREEIITVCPVDPYVDDSYFSAINRLGDIISEGLVNIALMGVTPTYPSEKYGYIIPGDNGEISSVLEYKEKPTLEEAKKYMQDGALWNAGIFAFKLGFILDKAHELIDFEDYADLYDRYSEVPAVSFDVAVVEKEKSLKVVRYTGEWKDIGTWNTLTEAMDENIIGSGVMDDKCESVHIINEMDMPILAMGLKDVVISASPEGILVSDKENSSYIGPYVEAMDQQVMFADKSWGSMKVLDATSDSMTIKLIIKPGASMNYHSHRNRDEVWVVLSGQGKTVVDGMEQNIRTSDVITMSAGCRHTIIADTELRLIEIQLGKEISVHDKIKYDMEY